MSAETAAPFTEQDVPKQPNSKKIGAANLFQTKWINKNLFFFLYLAFLAVGYIAYGHWTDKTLRKINKTEAQLIEYKYEYKTVKSEVMKQSEEQEVIKAVEGRGLIVSDEVPKRIVAEK